MNVDWLSNSPSKLKLINQLKIPELIDPSTIPMFCLDYSMSKRFAGLYHIDVHRVTIQPTIIDVCDDERFINLVLHELGHSTSKKTNRIERLWDNCSKKTMQDVYNLEEQIAEVIALIFELTIFNNNTTVNIRAFANYIAGNPSVYDFPWGEIDAVLNTVISKSKLDRSVYWSEKIKKYLTKNNLVRIKQGVFNGF